MLVAMSNLHRDILWYTRFFDRVIVIAPYDLRVRVFVRSDVSIVTMKMLRFKDSVDLSLTSPTGIRVQLKIR